MCHKCINLVLSLLILVFAFINQEYAIWVIMVSAVIIFLQALTSLVKEGCARKGCPSCESKKMPKKTKAKATKKKAKK